MRDIGDFTPVAINVRGQVVGYQGLHPVVWEKGALRDIDPSGRLDRVSGIDDRGRIVGIFPMRDGECGRVGLWALSRPWPPPVVALRRNPCAGGNHEVEFQPAVNERGEVAATGDNEAYLWRRGRRFALGGLPGAQRTIAVAISDRDRIVGVSGRPGHFDPDRAVLWTPRATR